MVGELHTNCSVGGFTASINPRGTGLVAGVGRGRGGGGGGGLGYIVTVSLSHSFSVRGGVL